MPATESKLHAFPFYDKLPRTTIIENLKRNLPAEIREQKAFVVFQYTEPRTPGGKRGKVPHYVRNLHPRTGAQGAPADLVGMATFNAAVECYRKHEQVAGIGICALKSVPLTFVDIDKCFDPDTGEVNALARECMGWGTYTEFSPGGRGLRLVLSGKLPQDYKKLDIGLELFVNKGFVTLTGMPFGKALPVLPVDQHATRLLELVNAPAEHATETPRSIPSPLTPKRRKDVIAALKCVDPDCGYDEWVHIGQALHSGDPDPNGQGFKLWLQWSAEGGKFADTSEEDMLDKWRSFGAGRGITLASLFHVAQQHGYDPSQKPVSGRKASAPPDIDLTGYTSGTPEQRAELDPLCPGLFDHVGAYMFIGRAKIGKSRILGSMVASALVGGKIFGFEFKAKCKVLALALEERTQDVLDRVRLYLVDPQEHPGMLTVVDQDHFLQQADKYSEDYDYMQWLDAVLARVKPRLVYLDPLVNLRMTWMHAPELRTKRITEEDYQMAAEIQKLAVKYQCVIVFSLHGNKRKSVGPGQHFDPFESVGTTSWTAAGCTGSLVIMDKPGHNPLEDDDDGQRVFSIRTRFRASGDEHLLLQSSQHGTISLLGPYRQVILTQRQHEMLELIAEAMAEGEEWVTGQVIARTLGCSQRNVRGVLGRFMKADGRYNGRQLVSGMHHGYRLQDVA